MFRKIISSSPFSSPAADHLFTNIFGDGWNGDKSFISTLRALVAPRMSGEDKLQLHFHSLILNETDIPTSNIARSLRDRFGEPGESVITVVNFGSHLEGSNKVWMSCVKDNFEDAYRGYTQIEKVSEFFKKTFDVLCFVNPETKAVTLFVEGMDARKLHYLQCAIFAFLPWYFNPEDGVSELEMELIQSLRERSSDKYEACLDKMAALYDFRSSEIRRLLKGFETRTEAMRISFVRNSIRDVLHQIDRLNNQIRDQLRQKRELDITLLGLEAKIAENSGESEIMDYFLKNKRLYLEEVDNSSMIFSVKGQLTFFDESMAESVINNRHSYIYNNESSRGDLPEGGMYRLMKAVFIDQILKVRICAAYRFYLGEDVEALSGHTFGAEFNDCMPNPHINIYSCMGDYEPIINEAIRDNEYLLAIEQSIASCQSLNFGDTTVMRAFMNILYGTDGRGYNTRCIELPDGTVVNPKAAIEWLIAQEETNE